VGIRADNQRLCCARRPIVCVSGFHRRRGWLHLEARYNYEALETGSVWAGYDFNAGKKLVLDLTPMVGANAS
jgi:hypothetical protein